VPSASMVDSMAMSARVTFLRRLATPSSRQFQGSRRRGLIDRRLPRWAAGDAEKYAGNTRLNTTVALRIYGQWLLVNTLASRTVRPSGSA
jgi:hypothetical protein